MWSTPDFATLLGKLKIWSTPDLRFCKRKIKIWRTPDFEKKSMSGVPLIFHFAFKK